MRGDLKKISNRTPCGLVRVTRGLTARYATTWAATWISRVPTRASRGLTASTQRLDLRWSIASLTISFALSHPTHSLSLTCSLFLSCSPNQTRERRRGGARRGDQGGGLRRAPPPEVVFPVESELLSKVFFLLNRSTTSPTVISSFDHSPTSTTGPQAC